MTRSILFLLPALLAAAPPPPAGEAVVPGFARDGFVQKKIDGAKGLWVQAQSGLWYYLKVRPRCSRLAAAELGRFSIDTGATGQLDRYATLDIQGQRCQLESVTEVPAPPRGGRS